MVDRVVRNDEAAGSNPAESIPEMEQKYGGKPASGSGCDYGEEPQASKALACGYGTKTTYKALKAELEQQLPYLPKHYLVDIRKMVISQFKKRFDRSRIPKYGSLNKGFTERELQLFFKHVTNPKFHLLFSYQANLGLRLGEVIKVNVRDIKFESRELVVKTEKAMTLDTLLIPAPLFKETLDFIKANTGAIEKADGYLFFKEEGKSHKTCQYVDEGYVRNQFREYIQKAKLDEVYDQSDESRPERVPRTLHRLTTHSLRHYAITHFAEQNNGNVLLTSKFARHIKTETTMTYIHLNKKALYAGIDGAFSVSQVESLKERLANV